MYTKFEFPRLLVGLSGGSASGKTTLCNSISNEMKVDKQFNVLILCLDSFQWGMRDYAGDVKDFNFDDPATIDWDLAVTTLKKLISGQSALIPEYNFKIHQREPEDKWRVIYPQDIIFLEGIFALYEPRVRNLMNYKIYIHCDDDIKLCRRIMRDIKDRGRDMEGVLYQYNRFVKPAFQDYVKPQMKYSDIIVPGFKNNKIAVNLIVQQLKSQNKELSILKNRMGNQLFFYGDLLHDLQICVGFSGPTVRKDYDHDYSLSTVDDQLQRRVFFTNDRQSQKELMVFVRYLIIGDEFSTDQYKQTLKTLLKYNFALFIMAMQLQNIDLKNIEAINIQILSQDRHEKTSELPYAVMIVPLFVGNEGQELIQRILDVFEARNQKVIIINFFAHIQNIMDITKIKQSSFCCVINSFMIASIEKFYNQLHNHINKDAQVTSNQFLADTLQKHLMKRLRKQQSK